jgi:eukaryotic-like serine/threonine-protein kinase
MPYAAPAGTELVGLIGAGSVFEVALVRQAGRTLVCKRLTPPALREAAGRAAIGREARFLSLAKHPSLPSLRGVGSDAAGPFLLETRMTGASIRAIVEGWQRRGASVPPSLVVHLATAAAVALAEIHGLADAEGPLDLVHGDLGPDHVLMGPLGQVSFVDLGAARFRGMEASLSFGDRGTLPFVAPEVARGDAAPSQAGDVYALSATLLFLATGAPIAEARDQGALLLEIGERGLSLARCDEAAGLPLPGREVLRAALAPDPQARTPTARALADALARALSWD